MPPSTPPPLEQKKPSPLPHYSPTFLTTAAGVPVVDNNNSATAGPRGLLLSQDIWLNEKLANFVHEVIPERRMHAKGAGAFGTFTVTNDITRYTRAALFSEVGKKTEMFARFSTVAGERGSADAERDLRGFSLRFYTEEGNWDLVGNNTPVFFFRDPKKFVDLNHAIKRDPRSGLRNATFKWDFWTLLPEALHQVTITMSDRGIPDGYRHMHGFGSHTFSFINHEQQRHWVKFHLLTQQGIKNLTDDEAAILRGVDPDSSTRDLFQAIDRGDYPRWTMYVQIMPEADAATVPYHPFDLTKVWPHADYPLIEVGVMELNRNPENYFRDVEQCVFSPSNVPPGIGFSPDRMLQSRLFNYLDAGRYRVGTNYFQIPVNRARCPVFSNHRDGHVRVDDNYGGRPHYEPNSFAQWQSQPQYREPPLKLEGCADVYNFREDDDDYFSQPRALFLLMTPAQRQALFDNTARHFEDAAAFVKERHAQNCERCHPDYGRGVRAAMARLNPIKPGESCCPPAHVSSDAWATRPPPGRSVQPPEPPLYAHDGVRMGCCVGKAMPPAPPPPCNVYTGADEEQQQQQQQQDEDARYADVAMCCPFLQARAAAASALATYTDAVQQQQQQQHKRQNAGKAEARRGAARAAAAAASSTCPAALPTAPQQKQQPATCVRGAAITITSITPAPSGASGTVTRKRKVVKTHKKHRPSRGAPC
uniref:Catalase n=1 Tax=Trypanosomatidae sp. Fi-14 TaxID=2582832 RepID=A0A515HL55_9TRYP|nr:catalase [Trypanosomatidae sp. Fi-14]